MKALYRFENETAPSELVTVDPKGDSAYGEIIFERDGFIVRENENVRSVWDNGAIKLTVARVSNYV